MEKLAGEDRTFAPGHGGGCGTCGTARARPPASPTQRFDAQMALMTVKPDEPQDKLYLQHIGGADGGHGQVQEAGALSPLLLERRVGNPWRRRRLQDHAGRGRVDKAIANSSSPTPESKDDKQISDINELRRRGVRHPDVSPNTTAALTPAVEEACARGAGHRLRPRRRDRLPGDVRQADRRLRFRSRRRRIHDRECPGGWQGAGAAHPARCRCPGDALVGGEADLRRERSTWSASIHRRRPGQDQIIVSDYIHATARSTASGWTPARPPCRDRGLRGCRPPVPAINGEDQQDFLQKWKARSSPPSPPPIPTYQWRTAIIAAVKILKGEAVPKAWNLPQPKITAENLDRYLNDEHAAAALRAVRLRGHA